MPTIKTTDYQTIVTFRRKINTENHKEGGVVVIMDPKRRLAGVSICSPQDTFNSEKGRGDAYKRLRKAIHKRPLDKKDLVVAFDENCPDLKPRQLARAAVLVLSEKLRLQWDDQLQEEILFAQAHPEHDPSAEWLAIDDSDVLAYIHILQ